MAAEKKAFPLRLNPELYEQLRRWADDELRSVNGQIEFILRQAVSQRGRGGGQRAERESGARDTAPEQERAGGQAAPPDGTRSAPPPEPEPES